MVLQIGSYLIKLIYRHMKRIKSWNLFESQEVILPVGTKIRFCGKLCQIVAHKATMHNEIYYLIKYEDGFQEVIIPRDKRIEMI